MTFAQHLDSFGTFFLPAYYIPILKTEQKWMKNNDVVFPREALSTENLNNRNRLKYDIIIVIIPWEERM